MWHKTDPLPIYSNRYLTNDTEFLLYFREKGVKLNTTFESSRSYWITNTNKDDKKKYKHPTIKPLQIIKTLIKNSSNENDIVADFFMGSGTTAIAIHRAPAIASRQPDQRGGLTHS